MLSETALGNWDARVRILLICVYSWSLYSLFDPFQYFPLNVQAKTSGLPWAWILISAALMVFPVSREAFWISLHLVSPFIVLDGLGRLCFGLIPNAVNYRNGRVLLPEIEWSLPFYLLLGASLLRPRIRSLGLLGFVISVYVYALLLVGRALIAVTQGMPLFPRESAIGGAYDGLAGSYLVPGLAVSVFFFLPLWRGSRVERTGVEIDPDLYPAFDAFVDTIRIQSALLKRPKFCLTADPNIRINGASGSLGLPNEPVVMIGAPALAVISQSSLRSILFHELAHFNLRHWRLHAQTYQVVSLLSRFALPGYSLHNGVRRGLPKLFRALFALWIWGPMPTLLLATLRRLALPARRLFELEADHFAATQTGKEATVNAICQLEIARESYWTYNCGPALAAAYWPAGHLDGFRSYFLSSEGVAESRSALQVLEMLPTGSEDEYPALGDRMAALQWQNSRVTAAFDDKDRPAYELFASSLRELQSQISSAELVATAPEGFSQRRLFRWPRLRMLDVVVAMVAAAAIGLPTNHLVKVFHARALVQKGETLFFEAQREPSASAAQADVERSLMSMRHAIEVNATDAMAHNDLGALVLPNFQQCGDSRNGLRTQAMEEFRMAIHLDPMYAQPRLNLGRAYFYVCDFSHALRTFEDAAAIDHASGSPEHSLGFVYEHGTGDVRKAAEYYCLAADRNPGRYDADCKKLRAPARSSFRRGMYNAGQWATQWASRHSGSHSVILAKRNGLKWRRKPMLAQTFKRLGSSTSITSSD